MVVSLLWSKEGSAKEQENQELKEPELHVWWHNPHWSLSPHKGAAINVFYYININFSILGNDGSVMGLWWRSPSLMAIRWDENKASFFAKKKIVNLNKHCEVLVSCSDWVDWIDFKELHACDMLWYACQFTPLLNGPTYSFCDQRSGILHIVRDP